MKGSRGLLFCLPLVLSLFQLVACGPHSESASSRSQARLLVSLMDPQATEEQRLQRIAREGREGNLSAVIPLLRVMKDRSHINFLPSPAPKSPFGYRAEEFKEVEATDLRAMDRTLAVCALEKIASPMALPDLALALSDRSPWVRNHAARALLHFGVRSGMQVLIQDLEGKAPASETANRILKQVTGQDFGFNPDIGWKAKAAAVARWRAWWKAFRVSGQKLPGEGRRYDLGRDPAADARLRFFTDVMGQFQKKYSEEARTALARLGCVALPFLREAAERARRGAIHPLAAAVAWVLGELDDSRCEAQQRSLLGELLVYPGSGAVRGRAALSLARHPGPLVAQLLKRSLKDPQIEVQVEGLGALGALGGPEALKVLEGFHPGENRDLADARAVALFKASRGKLERETVLSWLSAGPVDRRNMAYRALKEVTGHDVPITPESTRGELSFFARSYRVWLSR